MCYILNLTCIHWAVWYNVLNCVCDVCPRYCSVQRARLWRGRGGRHYNLSHSQPVPSHLLARRDGSWRQEGDRPRVSEGRSSRLGQDPGRHPRHCGTWSVSLYLYLRKLLLYLAIYVVILVHENIRYLGQKVGYHLFSVWRKLMA